MFQQQLDLIFNITKLILALQNLNIRSRTYISPKYIFGASLVKISLLVWKVDGSNQTFIHTHTYIL